MRQPPLVRTQSALRARMSGFSDARETTALVPTMGALHEGHLSLIRIAKRAADRVIVSVYVNPTQFAPDEDFEAYPRDTQTDLDMLAKEGVDLVYLPDPESMYASDHSTQVIVGGVGDGLETDHRPTFFHGVALVVTKLLNRVAPTFAIFGEKDYQQLAVIRRMVRDLDIPVEIIGGPIARDNHGLALSSRNRYFDEPGLALARQFNVILRQTVETLETGADVSETLDATRADILNTGFTAIDYVTLADAQSLTNATTVKPQQSLRLLAVAHCPRDGKDGDTVRLLDNFPVKLKTDH